MRSSAFFSIDEKSACVVSEKEQVYKDEMYMERSLGVPGFLAGCCTCAGDVIA
jgi:hypothetical protein